MIHYDFLESRTIDINTMMCRLGSSNKKRQTGDLIVVRKPFEFKFKLKMISWDRPRTWCASKIMHWGFMCTSTNQLNMIWRFFITIKTTMPGLIDCTLKKYVIFKEHLKTLKNLRKRSCTFKKVKLGASGIFIFKKVF